MSLIELKDFIDKSIEKHGKDKKIKIFNYKGQEVNNPNISEIQSDKGNWLEFL